AAFIAYLRRPPARRELLWLTVLVVWLLTASVAAAMVLTMGYDTYSVPGQLLLHTCWYVFPFVAPAIWWSYEGLQRRLRWPAAVWGALAGAAVIGCLIAQQFSVPGSIIDDSETKIHIDTDEQLALGVGRDRTPEDAVIISNRYAERYAFVFSGLTGRAAYMEGGRNTVNEQVIRVNPREDRLQRIDVLWSTTDTDRFCRILSNTRATHLVEFS